jgi:flavin reductase (DIM6/NTAB) family NADH-FMN oxidoreductase RutF
MMAIVQQNQISKLMSKTAFDPQKILFPLPVSLVVTGTMECANIVTIAWVSLLTSNPPTLGISVGTRGFSGNEILKNKHFTVNIAGVDIMEQADFCGITSGRDMDKFVKTGLTKLPSQTIASPMIAECPLNFECALTESSLVGTTNHFVGRILKVHMDTDKLRDLTDPRSFDVSAMDPLVYIGGAREYRRLGEKVGDAYQIGKKLR